MLCIHIPYYESRWHPSSLGCSRQASIQSGHAQCRPARLAVVPISLGGRSGSALVSVGLGDDLSV